VLVVCFLGILTYFEVTIDSESSFYASQLTIELALLLLILAVIAFENVGLRLLLLLAVVVALFINVFEVGYFLLYNRHSPECRNIYMFGIKVCISTQPPFTHHSTVAASFLALFHVILIVLATGLLASHPGTLCDLVERTNPQVVRRYLRQTNNKSFHMEYYVENGVFVGSGTETTNKAVGYQ
ncbi:hypothetical protein OSTOST_20098, partial [Ostertagia ostertagi]